MSHDTGRKPLVAVTSWNVTADNTDDSAVMEFLQRVRQFGTHGVISLQEVSSSLMEQVMDQFARGFNPAAKVQSTFESERIVRGERKPVEYFSVIIAFGDVRLAEQVTMAFPSSESGLGLSPRDQYFLYADAHLEGVPMRVFSARLPHSYPSDRMKCWMEIEKHLSQKNDIVCGDFGTREVFPYTLMNFWWGGGLLDGISPRERWNMETRFGLNKLWNPLRHKATHKEGQLDHILIPANTDLLTSYVHDDALGSAHHPLHVSFALEAA